MSQQNKSERIVQFLASLMPVYTHDYINEVHAARSLIDGTLVLPILKSTCPDWNEDELEDRSEEVVVFWQGDSARRSIVHGNQLVHLAIVKYAEVRELHLNGPEAASSLIKDMVAHYAFKTGQELEPAYYGTDKYIELIKLLNRATKKLGLGIVTDMLTTILGRK